MTSEMKLGMLGDAGSYAKIFEENQEDYMKKAMNYQKKSEAAETIDKFWWEEGTKTRGELIDRLEKITEQVDKSPFAKDDERFESGKSVVRNEALKTLFVIARLGDEVEGNDLALVNKMTMNVSETWKYFKMMKRDK